MTKEDLDAGTLSAFEQVCEASRTYEFAKRQLVELTQNMEATEKNLAQQKEAVAKKSQELQSIRDRIFVAAKKL